MGCSLVAFLICDNFHNRLTIQKEYLRAINAATSYVLLANPYFAPGRTFRDALTAAAVRGVDVKLLLGTGQYQFQDWVARSYYRKLLASGVTLIEYKKTQLHAKVAVIDDLWVTVGSSNCDGLSLFVNHEANLVIRDHTLASALSYCIRQGILDGVAVDSREFMVLPWYKRMLYGMAFLLYRAAMRLITLNQPWN
jgi:cardiolipin synthase